MMKVKPTVRELKVILNSLGVDKEIQYHYNDQRVRGGRIKAYFEYGSDIRPVVSHLFGLIELRLKMLFPDNAFNVEQYNDRAITVKWKDQDATFNW